MKILKPYAILIIAALIYHLGHPNHFKILIPFAPIIGSCFLIYFIMNANGLWQRVRFFLVFNLIITGMSFSWIAKTLQEFGSLPMPIAAIANTTFALIFQPHYWFLIFGLSLISKHKPNLSKTYFSNGLFSVVFAGFMTFVEYFLPQQFPVLLGQPWIVVSDFLGLAPVLGLPAFSFFSYLLCVEFIRLVKYQSHSKFNLVTCLVFIILNPLVASYNLTTPTNIEKSPSFNLRLVQANISNFLKVDSESGEYASVSMVLGRYKDLSLKPFFNNEQIDLMIWPETAYPYPINTDKDDLSSTDLPPIFNAISEQVHAEILFGGYDHFMNAPDFSHYMTEYNAAFHLNTKALLIETYHKKVLIPFGETLPFGPFNKMVSKLIPTMAFFAEGLKFPLFQTRKELSYITTICYELLRPEFIREYLNSLDKKPNFMINLTNDSWYGNTLEPEQHLFLARWRAIEFKLPILRATNTGVSVFLDAHGQEVKRLNYGISDNLDLKININQHLKRDERATVFQKFGFLSTLAIWCLCFIFQLLLIKFKYAKYK